MNYEELTYAQADTLLSARFKQKPPVLPEVKDLERRREFDRGEHWQNGAGFIGQLPTGEMAAERILMLKQAFSPEDVMSECLDTHVQNVLGEEPVIAAEKINDADMETLREWIKEKNVIGIMADALRGARRESRRIVRFFIPSGMIDGEGRIAAKDLREALSKIYIRSENIESGGVVQDETDATELALFKYRTEVDKTFVSLCEYAYLSDDKTIWGTKSAHAAKRGEEENEPFLLGGKLPIYELKLRSFVTDSVVQAQKDINLSGTMLTRNNNLAGSRERLAVGVQKPGEYVSKGTDEAGNKIMEFQPTAMQTGAGMFNFLKPEVIRDKEGNVTEFANPNIIFTDPVKIDSFIGTSDHWRKVIYAKFKMLHLLLADSATASGKSRIEVRKEFQASLNESKKAIDDLGVWAIATALNIAAHFIDQPGAYLETEITFDASISTVELTSEEIAQIREDFKAGLIDRETALEMRGFKDVQKILERIPNAPEMFNTSEQ